MFNIINGPARSSITLYNAGVRRFATQGSDNYDGTGTTQTIDVVASTAGSNANSVTWYVGENIQPAVASIKTSADRNNSKAPKNACYIRIASATSTLNNTSPMIGQEYIKGRTGSFTHDYYLGNSSILTDFALRRHTDYTINTEISGTIAIQEEVLRSAMQVRLGIYTSVVAIRPLMLKQHRVTFGACRIYERGGQRCFLCFVFR